ncbi:hypothetical protein Glove_19g49 [Diversispora epigaea]|uniref:Uncharacterized protein n=1 Tax=Diversispora epigaea TaxID=1348612 RepID=A0A397JVT3_9GLOM|nr:hypothetical protein Glove_19g49 [Diversispora epigaea]
MTRCNMINIEMQEEKGYDEDEYQYESKREEIDCYDEKREENRQILNQIIVIMYKVLYKEMKNLLLKLSN